MSSRAPMRAYSYAGLIPFAALLAACSGFKDDAPCSGSACSDAGVDGTTTFEAGPDAAIDAPTADADATTDAPIDAPIDPGAPFGSAIAEGLGDIDTQTGNAQQRHIVYAAKSGRFYFFYLDAAEQTKLKVRSTANFGLWREEPELTLEIGHGNEGRNFSVAT